MGYGCSVVRACELAQLQRATFHYQRRPPSSDELLTELNSLAQHYPRNGYRRAWAVLKRTRKINRKRVHRLWKAAQLQVKRVTRSRNRRERPTRFQADRPNHIWAYDFVQDADRHGNTLYILTVMDEFTREGLATYGTNAPSAEGVVAVLTSLRAIYGTPVYLRSDNGAEFTALALGNWLTDRISSRFTSIQAARGKMEKMSASMEPCVMNVSTGSFSVRLSRHAYVWKRFASSTLVNVRTRRSPIKHHWHSSKHGMRLKISSGILSFRLD